MNPLPFVLAFASVIDLVVVSTLLASSASLVNLYGALGLIGLLAVHVACAAGSGALIAVEAERVVRVEPWKARLFGAVMALFVPVVGPLGCFAATRLGVRFRQGADERPWVSLEPVELLDDRTRREHRKPNRRARMSVAEAAAALRLRDRNADKSRFEALLATRAFAPKLAVPLLKTSLGDPSDEIRLYAFSRLERMRVEIERNIGRIGQALETAEGDEAANLHLRLAECHWELVYTGLAEGSVLEHAIRSARIHAAKACAYRPGFGSAEFFLGRVLVHVRDADGARQAFGRAVVSGYPRVKILPYLAECAFYRRDFLSVQVLLCELEDFSQDNLFFGSVFSLWGETVPAFMEKTP